MSWLPIESYPQDLSVAGEKVLLWTKDGLKVGYQHKENPKKFITCEKESCYPTHYMRQPSGPGLEVESIESKRDTDDGLRLDSGHELTMAYLKGLSDAQEKIRAQRQRLIDVLKDIESFE